MTQVLFLSPIKMKNSASIKFQAIVPFSCVGLPPASAGWAGRHSPSIPLQICAARAPHAISRYSRCRTAVRALRDVSLTAPSVPRQTGGESTTVVLPLRRETSSGCTGDSPGIPTGRRRAPGILIGSPADVTGWPWWRRRPPAVCRESGRCCAGRRPQTAATGSRTTAERQQPPATPPTPGRRHSPRRDHPREWRSPAPPPRPTAGRGGVSPLNRKSAAAAALPQSRDDLGVVVLLSCTETEGSLQLPSHWNRKGQATLCVQSAQSRTISPRSRFCVV